MKKFEINRHLELKLERGKTKIYIQGELFKQCKSLMINITKDRITNLPDINSIDDIAERINYEIDEDNNTEISPTEEFWAHCSNLQAWSEHNYDSRLLHSFTIFSSYLQKFYKVLISYSHPEIF